MPENQSGNGKLDSWKAIASYLGRDVRTVIRWEKKRNLPVHRLPGGQAVFAYKVELDNWLKQGQNGAAPSPVTAETWPLPEPPQKLEPGIPASPRTRRPLWRYAAILGAVGMLSATVLAVIFLQHRSASASGSLIASVKFSPGFVQALDETGGVVWSHPFPKRIHREALKHADEMNRLAHFIDLYGDGHRETLITVPLERTANPTDMSLTEIDCFADDGTLLWSYLPQEKFRFGSFDANGPWMVEDVFVSEGQKPAIWAALTNGWGNSFVVQLDSVTGKDTVRFVNTGIIYKLNQTAISGKQYLLIGGFNNEYAAGMLAAMDETKAYAVSPQTAGTRHKCISCEEGAPDYYFVFPRSEINQLYKAWEDSVRFINIHGNVIEVGKSALGDAALEANRDVSKVYVVYDFQTVPDFRPSAFRFDSWYDMAHQDFQGKGRLDHGIESCPERLHPAPVRLWTPNAGWSQISLRQTTP